jgi:hypothetical protein
MMLGRACSGRRARGRPLLQQRRVGAAGAQGRSKHLPFAYRQVAHPGQAGQADHLTILLHHCCSSASPRVAHDSTFMRPALFCDSWAEKSSCSGKLLYKSNLFTSFYTFQSLSRRYNLSIKSVSARADQSQK